MPFSLFSKIYMYMYVENIVYKLIFTCHWVFFFINSLVEVQIQMSMMHKGVGSIWNDAKL